MSCAEPNKVFSVSTGLPWVLLNLLSVIVVFIADEAQLLDEQLVAEGLRGLVILNMASELRILRKLNQRLLNIHLQLVQSPGMVSIELFQGWLDSLIVPTSRGDDGVFVKLSLLGVNVAIDERARKRVLASFCAPHNNLPKLINKRGKV